MLKIIATSRDNNYFFLFSFFIFSTELTQPSNRTFFFISKADSPTYPSQQMMTCVQIHKCINIFCTLLFISYRTIAFSNLCISTSRILSIHRISLFSVQPDPRNPNLRNSETDECESISFGPIERSNENTSLYHSKRRDFLKTVFYTIPFIANTANTNAQEPEIALDNDLSSNTFTSSGFSKQEYTNSITASRDTNISPKEAYDTISKDYISDQPIKDALKQNRIPKALDLGAGAGVSTQLLYDMGYKDIDAIDWSGDAWRRFVGENEEDDKGGVRFWEMDDERFRDIWRKGRSNMFKKGKIPNKDKYDAIVYNFAVNENKAKSMAMEMLTETGKLLAPVNVQDDYWMKQSYRVYDQGGKQLWQTGDVGAWSVQFQPDVTQDSCQGIWCAPFNGYKKRNENNI